jgi:hypothetical protein
VKRRRDWPTTTLLVFVLLIALASLVAITVEGIDCMLSGGVYVKGFPWYACIGGTP